MPEGSLQVQVTGLDEALAGLRALIGEPGQGSEPGSGLTGAAGLLQNSPLGEIVQLRGSLQGQVSGVFQFDAGGIGGAVQALGGLRGQLQIEPGDALAGFQGLLDAADAALAGDFAGRLQEILTAVRSISEGVPENRLGVLAPLVDQLTGVLASLGGPEAERIQVWITGIEQQLAQLLPILEQAQDAPDPAAFAVQAFERSLDGVLRVFGFARLRRFADLVETFPASVLNAEITGAASASFTAGGGLYVAARAAATAELPVFRDAVAVAFDGLLEIREKVRPILSILRQVTGGALFQPGGLEAFLRAQIERIAAVEVQEVQTIDDPFRDLFDRIDAAIQEIDLSSVRTEVLGFFERTRETIEQVDIGSIAGLLEQQVASLEQAVTSLQEGVADLLARLQELLSGVADRPRQLLSQVGTFQPDGGFRFRFEDDLAGVLAAARRAIAGDPSNPGAASFAGTLTSVQATLDRTLGQLSQILEPVESGAEEAVTGAVGAIEGFSGFLHDLDLTAKLEALRAKVQEIVDALLPIDFAVVVDPIVQVLDENAGKLRDIDPESLNEMLRAALSAALEVVVHIDFTVTISSPLTDQFATVKAVPAAALDALQRRYEEAVAQLEGLDPVRLLEPLLAAFDVLERAVGSLDVAALLAPLDDLHRQALQEPLARLRPSQLVAPLAGAFQQLSGAFDGVSGTALLAPVVSGLDRVKGAVAEFDLTAPLDELIAAVAQVQDDLRAVRPSELLGPLTEELTRLEGELDRFKPSVLFAPVAELAAPLLGFLENVQQATVTALFEIFQAPLRVLESLEPDRLLARLRDGIDQVLALLRAANLPLAFQQLKARHFDLAASVSVSAGGSEARVSLAAHIDPQVHLGEIMTAYGELVTALERVKENLALPDLAGLYGELRDRLLSLLPPFARQALDVATFQRVMRLADPTRFLQELDPRFEAIKARLLPVRPADLAAELDQAYEAVLGLVDGLEIGEGLDRVRDAFARVQGIAGEIRVDFLAADVDRALADVRAVVAALDPARLAAELDAIHHEVELAVQGTLPSHLLAGLQEPLDRIQGILAALDPHARLEGPLRDAWAAVAEGLGEVDIRVVLAPLVGKLDELEVELVASLRRVETAFDGMLGAARGAMGGGGGLSASVSIDLGGGF